MGNIRYVNGDELRLAMTMVSLETKDRAGNKYIQMVEDMLAAQECKDIELVQVVRCKQCKYYVDKIGQEQYCAKGAAARSYAKPDFYCAAGESMK